MSPRPRLDRRELASAGSLAGDYANQVPDAVALLPGGGPGETGSVSEAPPAGPPPAGPALGPDAFGASCEGARRKLERILEGEGRLVTTGQQPLLFLGPLFVLYKALTAVERARSLEAETGVPCLAAFWIASDDHDWDEVGVTHLIDVENRLAELRLPPPEGWQSRAAGLSPLSGSVDELLNRLEAVLPPSDFVAGCLAPLRSAYRPGSTLSEAFGTALGAVLGDREIVWLDSGSRPVKKVARPLLRWALKEAAAVKAAIRAATERVERAGYQPRIPILDGATSVFYDTGSARERLYDPRIARPGPEDGGSAGPWRLRVGRQGEEVAAQSLLARLDEEPERFSPNVALRPVLESWLLPVAETVLGPGEISYWAQLGDLFRLAGVGPPRAVPRAAWTVVESKIERTLEKLALEPSELSDGGERAIRRVTEQGKPASVRAALRELRAGLDRGFESLREAVAAELPGIRSTVAKSTKGSFQEIADLESRIEARVREREAVLVDQVHKCALHLFPDRKPQERVLSPYYYLSRYGAEFVAAVEERTAEGSSRPAGAPAAHG